VSITRGRSAWLATLAEVSSSELTEHGSYVSDAVKIAAYRRPLTNLVRPDDVVIDMGCGTGRCPGL